MAEIHAITLDLDNTLWDVLPVVVRAEEIVHQYLIDNFPKIPELFSVDDVRRMREDLFHTSPHIKHDLTEQRRQLYSQLLEECGYKSSHADDLLRRFLVERNKVELYPDVLPALNSISQVIPIVSLTDGNASLDEIGIGKYFAGQVSAAQVGAMKPDVRCFQRASSLVGCEPGNVLHVGDHPMYDMYGARNAGMQTMWIVRNNGLNIEWDQDFQPDYTSDTLDDLVDLVC